MGGGGFNAFVLGSVSLPAGTSGSASLVNDTLNSSIDLDLTTYPSTRLAWAGTVNGNWDIGITPNWQTNADYIETVSGGPTVIFDDTAAGPYTAIVLNTNVAPSGVIVNNTALTYSISGAGGIDGAGGLTKTGNGLFTLGGHNIYSGGTTITSGTLALTTTNNAAMAYTNTGGTLSVSAASLNDSLLATALTFGNSNPQLIFNPAGFYGLTASLINDSGNLSMNGNVTVNVTNALPGTNVLLQYAGTRSGTGNFVAGTLPPGATLTDNPTAKTVTLSFAPQPQVFNPVYNTNETVVSVVTPQQFGAKGDGITDDSAAFQNAMNWVYNQGNWGGGVIYVPPANYAFYTNIVIPQGVTLHGDWTDWTTGTTGLAGTTFKVYFGTGQTNGPAFIFMDSMSSLKDINIWYPNQNPASITGYPFSIQISGNCVLKNLVLVNSYQGIEGTAASDSPIHIMSTVIGSPLYLGISLDMLADISETEDIRFSPNVWPASRLTNAPVVGGSYAAWMRANGEGMRLLRVDGELSMDTSISGYNVGIEANVSTNGTVGATFYDGMVTNCGIALLAQVMAGQSGLQFTDFTLDGDMAVDRTSNTNDATVGFDHCQLIGRKGTTVYATGLDWHSWMAFQNCTISNTLQLAGPGVFNVVDSSLTGGTNCVMSANATRVAFTGCSFSPATNIINLGNAKNLLMDPRQSISNALPIVRWTNVLNDYASRQPAKTNLYVATLAPWGAYGNGVNDDTMAIQSALNAAGSNGGGIVYLPGGKYHLTNTLVVPSGVELRGVHEMRSGDGYWADGKSKASVLEPYEGQGTTNGPVALALSANSGVVGVNFNYETQNANCIPFPATIQGQGPNVYAIGVVCPNSYYYVDLDTYTCANHLIYMVDGWIMNTGFHVGNGSSGSIVDCQENPSYWVVNQDSSFQLGNEVGLVDAYAATNAQMNILGNCTELLVKTFNINENTFMHCVAENGYGPVVTAIGTCCDGTVQGYLLDAPAASTINVVNSTMAIFSIIAPILTNSTVGVISTTNFLGTARFFNSALFGGPEWDFIVGGGDVGFDLVHMLDHAFNGSSVDGGCLHLINNGAYITYNGTSDFPPYNVTFGTNAGLPGIISEIIGGYAYNGWSYANANTNNPVNVWQDYALSSYTTLSQTNQFDELQPASPELLVQLDSPSQNLVLQWPAYTGTYQLFSTPALTPPIAWAPVTNSIMYSNGQWKVSLPLDSGGSEFYRLGQ
jgi:autotransporter-associated beta strand protein